MFLPFPKNQVSEIKSVIDFNCRLFMKKKDDSENEGITGNVIENKGPKSFPWGITGNVYEK